MRADIRSVDCKAIGFVSEVDFRTFVLFRGSLVRLHKSDPRNSRNTRNNTKRPVVRLHAKSKLFVAETFDRIESRSFARGPHAKQ